MSKIRKDRLYGLLAGWLIFSFIGLIIGNAAWDASDIGVLVGAGIWGFVIMLRLFPHDIESQIIESKMSQDKIVIASITKIESAIPYVCRVSRNYSDGVFKRGEEFASLDKARLWLDVVYEEELTKHLLKIGIQEKEIS